MNTLEEHDQARDILFLIGLIPNGLFYQDLNRMLETNINRDMKILEMTCLVEKIEDQVSHKTKYCISPYVEDYILFKMDSESEKKSKNLLCSYFTAQITSNLEDISYLKNFNKLVNVLDLYEDNIIDLIQYYF
jgi:hypothetical protein